MRAVTFALVASFILGLVLVAPAQGQPAEIPPRAAGVILSGDINCDSAATVTDALAGMRALAGLTGGDCLGQRGDVDCSSSTNLQDIIALRRHFAGLPVDLPVGCPAIGSERESGPGSDALIASALENGTITQGQGYLYYLQAGLAADELPAQFRGSGGNGVESSLFQQVGIDWPALSPAERDALRPYLLPPADPASWTASEASLSLSPQWQTTSNARIKVWWQAQRPEDEAKAIAILNELDSVIWPDLVGYMGAAHAPFSDAAELSSGGDGKYDVYLVHNAPDQPGDAPVLGYVTTHLDAQGNKPCTNAPTYMVLNSREPLNAIFLSTVAHEFMHSIQFTYNVGDCGDYSWLMESTAEWAESWVYPDVNGEHPFSYGYLDDLQTPLEHWEYKHPHQYGSYLFWYYLEKKEGIATIVRDVWSASGNPDSLAAIESVLAPHGGLKKLWPKSALYNWNRPPFEDFTELDQVPGIATWKDTNVNASNVSVSYPVPTDLGHMAQDHYHYEILDGVKSLTFINPFAGTFEEHLKIQALVNINGTWEPQPRDWTEKDRVSFCFDRADEKVKELVIIITNSTFDDRSHRFDAGPGELVASPLGCKGWTGTASAEVNYFDAKFTITVDNMRFAPQPDLPSNERYDFYDLVEVGTATWHVSGTWPGGCTPSGTMTLGQPGTPDGMNGDITVDRQENAYYIHAGGHKDGAMFTITCGDDSFELVWPVLAVIWNGGGTDTKFKVEGNAQVMDAEHTDPLPFYGGTWRWRFEELK